METTEESVPAYATVAKWHAEFKRRTLTCDDLHRCGRPASSVNEETVEKVNTFVMSDRRLLQFVSSLSLLASLLVAYVRSCRKFVDEKGVCTIDAANVI